MQSLTWNEVRAHRLARQFLHSPAPRMSVVEVVRNVCGIHAQVMPSAELSLGLRVEGLTRHELATELWERRSLVKTYGVRGTVHLLPSDELALWLAAFRANSRRNNGRRLEYLGLTPEQMNDMVAAIGDALEVEQRLTREELGVEIARRVGVWATERRASAFGGQWPIWMSAIGAAAHAGTLCFGPNDGTRVTFEPPARWIGAQPAIDGDEALRAVFRRYLASYGPATHAEFAQWFAMPASHAREVARSLRAWVEEVDVEGRRALQLADDRPARGARAARSVMLLPRFDPYVVGSHPRDELIPPSSAKHALATGILPKRARTGREFLAGPMPVLLVDGQVAGVWEQHRARGRIAMRVQTFVRLTADDRRELESRVDRIGLVLGEDAVLSFGAITTRPHL